MSKTPVEDELRGCGEYMRRVRGLAPATQGLALGSVRRLLAGGAFPKEVAEVLRHRSLNTTLTLRQARQP